MRRFISLSTSLLLVAFLGSCAGRQADDRIRIGVCVDTMQEPVYGFMKTAILAAAAKDKNAIYWLSAEHDEARQLADVENLVAQRVDALILHAVNPGTASVLVKAAKTKGIPVVAMDRLPANSPLDALISADSVRVGRLQAEFVVKRLNGKGKVVILEGEAGNQVAKEITQGNKDVLAQHPGMRIVVDQAHQGWARDLALATVENALVSQNNDIQAVLANNSGMAMGAVQALDAKGLAGKVLTVGSDADKDAVASILQGKLSADVDKRPTELGLAAYRTAYALAAKAAIQKAATLRNGAYDVPVVLTPVTLVEDQNVAAMAYRWPDLPYVKP